MTQKWVIREETPADVDPIAVVETAAFGRSAEAELVNRLRQTDACLLSLVAEEDHQIIGHLLYSMGEIRSGEQTYPAVMLGPVAVLPDYQNQGVGQRLITAGNGRIAAAGHRYLFVLGHASYYPKFGFRPASQLGFQCAFNVPDEAFMGIDHFPGEAPAASGTVYYHPAFDSV